MLEVGLRHRRIGGVAGFNRSSDRDEETKYIKPVRHNNRRAK